MSYVHHSNYLKYYEIGRLGWLKEVGFSYKKMEEENIILPVIRTNMVFRKPAFFEDELLIKTYLIKKPSYSIEFEYNIYRKKELINEGYVNNILISQDVFIKMMLKSYGGNGYTYILKYFKKRLKDIGVSDKDFNEIISENPKRVFS